MVQYVHLSWSNIYKLYAPLSHTGIRKTIHVIFRIDVWHSGLLIKYFFLSPKIILSLTNPSAQNPARIVSIQILPHVRLMTLTLRKVQNWCFTSLAKVGILICKSATFNYQTSVTRAQGQYNLITVWQWRAWEEVVSHRCAILPIMVTLLRNKQSKGLAWKGCGNKRVWLKV